MYCFILATDWSVWHMIFSRILLSKWMSEWMARRGRQGRAIGMGGGPRSARPRWEAPFVVRSCRIHPPCPQTPCRVFQSVPQKCWCEWVCKGVRVSVEAYLTWWYFICIFYQLCSKGLGKICVNRLFDSYLQWGVHVCHVWLYTVLLITIPLGKESLRQLHTDGRWACEGSESGRWPPCTCCSPACLGSSCPLTTPGAHRALRAAGGCCPRRWTRTSLPPVVALSPHGRSAPGQSLAGGWQWHPVLHYWAARGKSLGRRGSEGCWPLYSVTPSCVLAKVINFCTTITFSYHPFYFFHLLTRCLTTWWPVRHIIFLSVSNINKCFSCCLLYRICNWIYLFLC